MATIPRCAQPIPVTGLHQINALRPAYTTAALTQLVLLLTCRQNEGSKTHPADQA